MTETIDDLKKKIVELKEKSGVDLSTDEDLAIGVMNLISLEEHFFWTSEKTGKGDYMELLGKIREIRKVMLARLLPKNEGETWCAGKHLLAASMRLSEVATKLSAEGKSEDAKKVGDYSADLFSLFFALRLKLLSVPELKEMSSDSAWTLQDIMKKLVNCCDE